jgi:hypothetical protein
MIEIGVPPIVGVMAIGTLTAEVVIGFITGVAAGAVGLPGVVEVGVPPIVGVVAIRTLTAEVVVRSSE